MYKQLRIFDLDKLRLLDVVGCESFNRSGSLPFNRSGAMRSTVLRVSSQNSEGTWKAPWTLLATSYLSARTSGQVRNDHQCYFKPLFYSGQKDSLASMMKDISQFFKATKTRKKKSEHFPCGWAVQ
jgi:hypothetical protein